MENDLILDFFFPAIAEEKKESLSARTNFVERTLFALSWHKDQQM